MINSVDTSRSFELFWCVWHYTGIKSPKNLPPMAYNVYAILLNICVTVLFPISLIANLFFVDTQAQFFENLAIIIPDIMANFKFVYVWFAREKFLSIIPILRQLDNRAQTVEERMVLAGAVRTARNTFKIFAMLFAIGTSWSVIKLLLNSERCLIYPAWFNVNWKNSNKAYILLCIYQIFGLSVQAVQNCANDAYPPGYLCVLSAHMHASKIRIQRLGGSQTKHNWCRVLSQPEHDSHFNELITCVKDHNLILSLHHIINDILSICCLAQFVCTVMMQCILGLHFLYVLDANDHSGQLLSIIFFIAVTLESFVICYFGNCVRESNQALNYAFYDCNWLVEDQRFKRVLLIALLRSQRESRILAGNYIAVDLANFLKMIKYAYSAFTLLIRFK